MEPKEKQHAPLGDFNMLTQAVFDIQRTLGEQSQQITTLNGNDDSRHEDFEKLRAEVSKLSHTIYAASALISILGIVAAWLIEKIWTLLLPYLQAGGMRHP
jgi:hypothetical protein